MDQLSELLHGHEGTAPSTALLVAQSIVDIGLEATSAEDALSRLQRLICGYMPVAKVGIAIWSETRDYLQTLPGSFNSSLTLAASSQIDANDNDSFAAQVAKTREARYTNDPEQDLVRVSEWVRGFGIEQMLTVPLVANDTCIGVLHLANRPGGFGEQDIEAIQPLTCFIASAITQVLQRRSLKRQEALSSLIGSTATMVVSGDPLEQIAGTLFRDFCHASDTSAVAVTFFADSSPSLVSRYGDVDVETEGGFLAEAQQPHSVVRAILSRPARAGDAGAFAIHVPIVIAGRAEGKLSILRVPGIPFSQIEREAILRLANVMALAWVSEHYQLARARNARLQERQRIADDLHDRVAQSLFSGELALHSARHELPEDSPAQVRIREAHELLVKGQLALRDAIHQLSQPAKRDLAERLTACATLVENQFGIGIHLDVDPTSIALISALSSVACSTLVQVAREGMVNAAKHAGPCRISVVLRPGRTDELVLLVCDDGIGYSPGLPAGHGIASLRRRLTLVGGTLTITRGRTGGTKYRAAVPVRSGHDPALR